MWLLYLTPLLSIAATVLVHSFVEPLEAGQEWAQEPWDRHAGAAPPRHESERRSRDPVLAPAQAQPRLP